MALLGLYFVACGLLAAAGAVKAVRPSDTARAVHSLTGLPALVLIVRFGGGAEALLGVAGLIHPTRAIAILVAASYVMFSGFVFYARAKGGMLSTCGCFGSSDTPPTFTHATIDVALAASALSVAWSIPSDWLPSILSHQYDDGVPLVAACALCGWLTYVVLSPLARLRASAQPTVVVSRSQP